MTDEYQTDSETNIEKDGSGNLVIKNIDEATLEKILDSAGTTVYDASSKTVGDGTTSANHETVNTGTIVDSDDGTSYDIGDDLAGGGSSATAQVPDSGDDIQTYISNRAGEIVDLGGQTFEVTSSLSVPGGSAESKTVVRNGRIKLADGADSDLFKIGDTSYITFENIVWDFNGSNNTGAPTNNAYFEISQSVFNASQDIKFDGCWWINATGRVSGNTTMVLIDVGQSQLTGCKFILDPSYADMRLTSGTELQVSDCLFKDMRKFSPEGQDANYSNCQWQNNEFDHVPQADERGNLPGDHTFNGCIFEDARSQSIFFSQDIDQYQNWQYVGCQFQGSAGEAVIVNSGAAVSGRLMFKDCAFKRNQFGSGGTGAHITVNDGDHVEFQDCTATNDAANDAAYWIDIASGADTTVVHDNTALDGDFATSAINDNGTTTDLADNITT